MVWKGMHRGTNPEKINIMKTHTVNRTQRGSSREEGVAKEEEEESEERIHFLL
jgi:hypothetical protein